MAALWLHGCSFQISVRHAACWHSSYHQSLMLGKPVLAVCFFFPLIGDLNAEYGIDLLN